jgi:hypothetical protein
MRRGTLILLLFIVIAAGVVGLSQFLRRQPPLQIALAVNPLAESWVRDAVTRLNSSEPTVGVANQRVQFVVSVFEDIDVWAGTRRWTAAELTAWLPASSISVEYAGDNGIPLREVSISTAQTPLVWGGYLTRVDVLTDDGTIPLDWDVVAEAAANNDGSWQALGGQADWRFLKLGFGQPNRTMSGLGALFTGVAHFADSTDLTGGATRDSAFRERIEPVINSVPNFNTLGGDPAAAMARGPSTVEIALFPESQWLTNLNGMAANEPVRLNYPTYQFVLDFPLVAWQDIQTTPEQIAAVDRLSSWLLADAQQASTVSFGLRPASGQVQPTATLFANAVQYGVEPDLAFGQPIQPPARSDAQALIQWFIANQ